VKPALPPKPARESRAETTEVVLPSHTNQLGTIFGGQLMAWVDIAASISAARHARGVCVTASLDALHFLAPVKLGEHIRIRACVNYAGRTSMEVGARLDSEDPQTGRTVHVATAYLTFVAIDPHGRPRAIAPLLCESPDEKRRHHEAELRRASRLRLKSELARKSLRP
jgi:acyl-CoA hydrolase